jgi:hypothetical protein
MAPEQILEPAKVGPAADIFALGLVLYELVTGVRPPAPPEDGDLVSWASREVPLPREVNPDVPEPLQRICLKAVEPILKQRYLTALQLADDLRRFAQGAPVRTRPTRYVRLLEDRVRSHMDELAEWHQENLITQREADSMQDKYLGLLRADSLWLPGARRLRAGPILVQLGGWLIVVSAILWPAFYWLKLQPLARVVAVGIPALIVNGALPFLWRRFNRLVALIFTITGMPLLTLLVLVLLSEFNLWDYRVDDGTRHEMFGPDRFSNVQVAVACWLTSFYALWWVFRRKFVLLAIALTVFFAASYASTLLIVGMKDWLMDERYAATAIRWLPFVLIMYLAARLSDRPPRNQLAVPFYAGAAVAVLAVTSTLAYDAPNSWLHIAPAAGGDSPNWLRLAQSLFFLACGLMYFILAWAHDRSGTRLRRLWGRIFYKIVPPFCIIPLDLAGDEPLWVLGRVGEWPVTVLELCVPLAGLLFVGVGAKLQLRWFMYYGLVHLTFFVIRSTDRYFKEVLSWPVYVLVLGTVSIAIGILWERRRLSRNGLAPSDSSLSS